MGDDDARTLQLGQILGDDILADIVEYRCRLVEEKNFRLSHQCTGNEDALPLSAGHTLAIDTDGGLHTQWHLL